MEAGGVWVRLLAVMLVVAFLFTVGAEGMESKHVAGMRRWEGEGDCLRTLTYACAGTWGAKRPGTNAFRAAKGATASSAASHAPKRWERDEDFISAQPDLEQQTVQ